MIHGKERSVNESDKEVDLPGIGVEENSKLNV